MRAIVLEDHGDGYITGECPWCHERVDSEMNPVYCGWCGREIAWDEFGGGDGVDPIMDGDGESDWAFCGVCGEALFDGDRFCSACGRRIRWPQ